MRRCRMPPLFPPLPGRDQAALPLSRQVSSAVLRARVAQLHCLSLRDVQRFGFETLWRFATQCSGYSAVAVAAAVKAI